MFQSDLRLYAHHLLSNVHTPEQNPTLQPVQQVFSENYNVLTFPDYSFHVIILFAHFLKEQHLTIFIILLGWNAVYYTKRFSGMQTLFWQQ